MFTIGTRVRITETALAGKEGAITDIRRLSGEDWFSVEGEDADGVVWNAPFRPVEMEAL